MSFDPNSITPAVATPTEPVAQPTTPAVTPQAATPPAPVPTPEDRSNWVPPYRLRETTTKYEQQLAQIRAASDAEKAQLTRQLQALTGALPPQNQEHDQVRNQFKTVFPELDELGSNAAAIKELIALKDELRAAMQNQWATHNRNAINGLYKAAEATYGTSLNEDARRALGSSFVGHLQSNPDIYEQYQQDPAGVVEEYWKGFTERFISPIQRAQTVATIGRIPQNIPQDTPSGALPTSVPQTKFATQEDRLNAALASYKTNTKQGF